MAPSSPVAVHRLQWHSPVPYLFGGLATIMGLIAFALLLLACSYWKLSRNLRNAAAADRDLEAGDGKADNNKILTVYEEMYLVVMAGEQKPTFLAIPSSSRTSSFGGNSCRSSDQVQVSSMWSRESAEQVF
ncbi:hypothetical protein L1987_14358 [Smallanthus sonchifolius]|uniref:Uncharacterized protein n=1 Tax=Smallanthus sonchifolius TaxID=185202 RepID=A0ACB9J3F7_9ASTR|nr:hypothetical protein L1987_14358 [Smallanthus sonchifolius]